MHILSWRIRLSIGLVASMLIGGLSGQRNSLRQFERPIPTHKHAIRTSLISWLDPTTSSVRLGYEHRRDDRRFLRYEGGYYFTPLFADQPGLLDLHGFSLSATLRTISEEQKVKDSRAFVEFNFIYRYLDVDIAGDFNRFNRSFQQRFNYSVWEHYLGLSCSVGSMLYLGKHLLIDLSIGMGLMGNLQAYSQVPADARFSTNEGLDKWALDQDNPDASLVFIVPIGFSLIYHW
ncbi:MAG: hypothetical protein AAF828_03960 [Bacteroidota bacterium]